LRSDGISIFSKNMSIYFVSCENTSYQNEIIEHEELTLELKMTEMDSLFSRLSNGYFMPIYIDNSKWSSIEFICNIKLKTLQINSADSNKNFEYVRLSFLN
jgi:hypothetical protein